MIILYSVLKRYLTFLVNTQKKTKNKCTSLLTCKKIIK